jgi:hypothetical protein
MPNGRIVATMVAAADNAETTTVPQFRVMLNRRRFENSAVPYLSEVWE